MSKHTPGPWVTGTDFPRDIEKGDFTVATCYGVNDNHPDWDTEPEALANARLIAAAPELLLWANRLMDELQAARDANPEAFAEFVNEVCSAGFADACIAMARTISKAEGQSVPEDGASQSQTNASPAGKEK